MYTHHHLINLRWRRAVKLNVCWQICYIWIHAIIIWAGRLPNQMHEPYIRPTENHAFKLSKIPSRKHRDKYQEPLLFIFVHFLVSSSFLHSEHVFHHLLYLCSLSSSLHILRLPHIFISCPFSLFSSFLLRFSDLISYFLPPQPTPVFVVCLLMLLIRFLWMLAEVDSSQTLQYLSSRNLCTTCRDIFHVSQEKPFDASGQDTANSYHTLLHFRRRSRYFGGYTYI